MIFQYNGSMEVVAQQGLWHVLDQCDPDEVDSGQVKVYQIYIHEKGEFKTSSLCNCYAYSLITLPLDKTCWTGLKLWKYAGENKAFVVITNMETKYGNKLWHPHCSKSCLSLFTGIAIKPFIDDRYISELL